MIKARFKRELIGSDIILPVFSLSAGEVMVLPEFRKQEIFTVERPKVLHDHYTNTLIRTEDGIVYIIPFDDLEPVEEKANALTADGPVFMKGPLTDSEEKKV